MNFPIGAISAIPPFRGRLARDGFRSIPGRLIIIKAQLIFTTSRFTQPVIPPGFGAQKMSRDLRFANIPKEEPPGAWERCIRDLSSVRASRKASSATLASPSRLLPTVAHFLTRYPRQMVDVKRAMDREPFVKELIGYCETGGSILFP